MIFFLNISVDSYGFNSRWIHAIGLERVGKRAIRTLPHENLSQNRVADSQQSEIGMFLIFVLAIIA